MSQAELARRMYLTQSSVAEWESGRKSPSVKHLIRLAMLLGVSFEWLSTGRGEMHAAPAMQETTPGTWGIPDDERQLLNCYARLKPPQRVALLSFLQSLAA